MIKRNTTAAEDTSPLRVFDAQPVRARQGGNGPRSPCAAELTPHVSRGDHAPATHATVAG
jgi:hypothetical protein